MNQEPKLSENSEETRENASGGQENNVSGEQNNVSGGQNNVSGGQKNVSGGQNNDSGEQNNVSGGQNNDSGGQNNDSGRQNNDSGEQNNDSGGQNNVSGEQNNLSGEQNNVSGGRNNLSDGQNNLSGEQNNRSGEQNNLSEKDESSVSSLSKHARSTSELMAVVEALIFVADEPLTTKMMADVLDEGKDAVLAAVEALSQEYDERDSGLQIREIAGGWQIATRTEYHEEVRQFLKTRPSAKLSLASLETLAVIAYKQPVTVPEILEIRGVQSASAIKTLLEKRLIVTKGHKETVGRPMTYGTSKDFLIQFGLKDLSELPSIEDFEDLAGSI